MTTIVVNKTGIAADRMLLVTGDEGGRHFCDGPKIKISDCGTFAYGSTGLNTAAAHTKDTEELLRTIVNHVSSGGLVDDKSFTDVCLAAQKRIKKPTLILTRKTFISVIRGIIAVADDSVDFFTVGTGSAFAMVAMNAERTPTKAVEFACSCDTLSGGAVDFIRANKLKAIKVA